MASKRALHSPGDAAVALAWHGLQAAASRLGAARVAGREGRVPLARHRPQPAEAVHLEEPHLQYSIRVSEIQSVKIEKVSLSCVRSVLGVDVAGLPEHDLRLHDRWIARPGDVKARFVVARRHFRGEEQGTAVVILWLARRRARQSEKASPKHLTSPGWGRAARSRAGCGLRKSRLPRCFHRGPATPRPMAPATRRGTGGR